MSASEQFVVSVYTQGSWFKWGLYAAEASAVAGANELATQYASPVRVTLGDTVVFLLDAVERAVARGPKGDLDADLRPNYRSWFDAFARLVTDVSDPRGGWTHAKIRDRAERFAFDADSIEFEIERHPAGLVERQRWRYWLSLRQLQLLEKTRVGGEFFADGQVRCPHCLADEANLHLVAGRATCRACGYEVKHEHTP